MKLGTTLGAMVVAGVLGLTGAVFGADTYQVDPVHSTAIFKITHFNMAPFYGRVVGPTGTFVLDEDVTKSTFQVELSMEKIDTANEKRDNHLKGPDFFNVKQYPTTTFKSTGVKKGEGENVYEVTGDLTLHGVTKPVTLKVEKTGQGKDPMGKERAGLAVETKIKRSDFGVSYMPQGLGDEVTLMFGIEGLKQ